MDPFRDHDNYDVWTDGIATGELDPDGLPRTRLPGRGPAHRRDLFRKEFTRRYGDPEGDYGDAWRDEEDE